MHSLARLILITNLYSFILFHWDIIRKIKEWEDPIKKSKPIKTIFTQKIRFSFRLIIIWKVYIAILELMQSDGSI